MEIRIDSVVRVLLSDTHNSRDDEPDEEVNENDDEPFYRRMRIETATGVIELVLSGTTEEALDLIGSFARH